MREQVRKSFFIDDWRVSPPEGLLARGTEIVHLEPKAMEVLAYLSLRPGAVVTREELERDVWRGADVGYDAVTSTIIKLRKALQDNARQPRFIATIPKMGYQLIASITYPEDEASPTSATQISPEQVVSARQVQQPQPRVMHRASTITAVLMGVVVLMIGWFWLSAPTSDGSSGIARPSIVVLPFENLSNDAKQQYLADGITEDISTNLSRLSSLLVIASSASIGQVKPQDIGNNLNVDFVLKGNIRQFGETIRVNAQLIDTKNGFIKWAERYDRKVGEVFAVQDEVTHSIIDKLAIKITRQETSRLAKNSTFNLMAYDFFQEGQRFSKISTKESNGQAREMYRKAIELDPGYGRAYGAQAYSLAFGFLFGWNDSPVEALDRALELAKKGVALDDSVPQTHWALGYVYLIRQEYDLAEKAVSEAIAIAPSYADGYGLLALISNNLGQPKKAIGYVTKGMRLNPYYTWDYPYNLGRANYMLGNYDAAIVALEKAQERNENAIPIKLYLAVSYVKAKRQSDAEWVSDQLQMLTPPATITQIEKTQPIVNSRIKKMFLEDLRRAGLPE